MTICAGCKKPLRDTDTHLTSTDDNRRWHTDCIPNLPLPITWTRIAIKRWSSETPVLTFDGYPGKYPLDVDQADRRPNRTLRALDAKLAELGWHRNAPVIDSNKPDRRLSRVACHLIWRSTVAWEVRL